MFFRIPNRLQYSVDEKKTSIKRIAYGRIMKYKVTPKVLALSQYWQQNYNMDLKTYCKWLVLTKVIVNSGTEDDAFIVTFIDKESDNAASLITYGNSEVQGCNILQFAFNQDY